jgi:asparagine N-glycosylation enzyme membrane subunit Stt3
METVVASKISHIRGWILIILGSLLTVGIAGIAAFLASTIAHHDAGNSTRWTGSHDFTVTVFELFAAIFVFGLAALGGGIFQLRRGRPSKLAMLGMLILVVVMFFLGKGIMSEPGK